jgi:hypothetical protein
MTPSTVVKRWPKGEFASQSVEGTLPFRASDTSTGSRKLWKFETE